MFGLSLFSKKQLIFIGLFVFLLGFFALNQIADFDTFYHLKTGEYIWQNKIIPETDIFSFTAQGQPWITHYWLSDVVFHLVFGVANNFWFLIIFVGLIASFTHFFILKNSFYRGGEFFSTLALIVPIFYLTMDLWVVRPQIFSFLFCALLLFILEKSRRQNNYKILGFIPLIILFWVNCHAGVLIGLGILLMMILASITQILIKKWNILNLGKFIEQTISNRLLLSFIIIFIVSIGFSFLNPNGLKAISYLQEIKPTAQALGIEEWKSLLSFLSIIQAKIFLGMMVVVVAFILWRFFKRRRLDVFDLGLVLIEVALPLISIRHIIFFPLLIFPIFVAEIANCQWWKGFLERQKVPHKEKNLYQILFLLLLIFLLVKVIDFPRTALNNKYLPIQAVDFIKKENIQGPMYNLEMGGYLIWRLWPEQKVFLDGRNEVYAGKPAEDYINIAKTEGDWERLIDEYGINYFVLWYRDPLYNLVAKMEPLIKEKGFRLVYWDDVALVYVKDNKNNESVIKKYEYQIATPFLPANFIKFWDFEKARQDLLRGLELNPDSQVLLDYATILVNAFKSR